MDEVSAKQTTNSIKQSSKVSTRNSKDIKQFNGSQVSDAYDKEVEKKVEAAKRRNPLGRFFGYLNAKMCKTNPSSAKQAKQIDENAAHRIRESIKERRPSNRN